MKMKRTSLYNIISLSVPLVPIFSIYRFFIEGLSLAEVMMIILILSYLISKRIRAMNYIIVFFLFTYLFLSLLLSYNIVGYFYSTNILTRFGKLFIYTIYGMVVLSSLKYSSNLLKYFNITGFMLYLGLVTQYIIYALTSRYFVIKIPLIPYVNDQVSSVDFSYIRSIDFRPSSLFLEPAHFAVFAIFHLLIILYSREITERKKLVMGISISLFALLSTSSTALVVIPIIWILYYLFISSNTGKKQLYFVTVLIFLFTIFQFDIVRDTFDRVINLESIAVTGRVFAGSSLLASMNARELLFGVGFGNVATIEYMNSFNLIIFYLGRFGIAIFSLISLVVFLRSNRYSKLILFVLFLLMGASPVLFSSNISLIIVLYGIRSSNTNNSLKGNKNEENNSLLFAPISRV